ncbi:MAG: UDP-N-acetylmuramoyl-tripeptide--D-alanyl-D-alanine ligase [Deltaproteobacteria bacterium]|nr:UDP-N-acetylmuramoyl-tripeptide--D-alanyl-D-alanine ligase [Deltaproteobacteria bacterium]
MEWRVSQVLEATGGRLVQGGEGTVFGGFSTDSRTLEPGAVFVALPGERHDGHAYVGDVLKRGAAGVVVQADRFAIPDDLPPEIPVIQVTDTLRALGDLAGTHRRRLHVPVVGITGSNGKTSTKEMVFSILSQDKKVLKNKGNFNNLIGVPLTLLSLQPDDEVAVVEMGINIPGEMSRLVEITQPDVGLITNIHPAHLEGLGSEEQILAEKGMLWKGMAAGGLAVVNQDDPRLPGFARCLGIRAVHYSMDDTSVEVFKVGPVEMEGGHSVFGLQVGGEMIRVRLCVLGLHQVNNALAAAAVAFGMGVPSAQIQAGLASHRPVHQRMEMHVLPGGRVLVDDTYNANPRSVVAAVRTICAASKGKPVAVVLGDMKELGPETRSLHLEVGKEIGSLGVARLFTFGELSREIEKGARESGLSERACFHGETHEDIVNRLQGTIVPGEWVLVKGSRSMNMERVVEGLMDAEGRHHGDGG